MLDMIVADLRAVRRGRGEFTPDRLTSARALVEYLGRGSEDLAYSSMLDIMARCDTKQERDIGAFFYTCGLDIGGESLDWRLDRYAKDHFLEKRTALRRSDRGAIALARLIRDSFENERPWAHMAIAEVGGAIVANISLSVPIGSSVPQPHVYVNHEPITGLRFKFDEEGTHPLFLTCSQRIPNVSRVLPDPYSDIVATLDVYWMISVWPTWMLGTHLRDPDLWSRLKVNRRGNAIATIHSFTLSDRVRKQAEFPALNGE